MDIQDRIPLGGAASGTVAGYVTTNPERPLSASSVPSRGESLATPHLPSDAPDKLASSQPITAVQIQVAINQFKEIGRELDPATAYRSNEPSSIQQNSPGVRRSCSVRCYFCARRRHHSHGFAHNIQVIQRRVYCFMGAICLYARHDEFPTPVRSFQ